MPQPIAPARRSRYRWGMLATVLSLLMLAAIALGAGGVFLILRKRDYKRGWLMIAAAVVMLTNVAIMTAPME